MILTKKVQSKKKSEFRLRKPLKITGQESTTLVQQVLESYKKMYLDPWSLDILSKKSGIPVQKVLKIYFRKFTVLFVGKFSEVIKKIMILLQNLDKEDLLIFSHKFLKNNNNKNLTQRSLNFFLIHDSWPACPWIIQKNKSWPRSPWKTFGNS